MSFPNDIRLKLQEKFSEALVAVTPILIIVLILSFTVAQIPTGTMLCFLIGAILLIVGMMFFTLGADLAMVPIGEYVGSCITRSKKIRIIVPVAFLIGFIITIAEPDLQVLAEQVPSVPNMTLILCVAAGVGLFLVIALLRMFLNVPLSHILIFFYIGVFILSNFVPENFLAVAFDSGGVTTGPMTVPFIMALGVGVASIRSDKHAEDDSFGLVALCSIGPILSVMILGIVFSTQSADYVAPVISNPEHSVALARIFGEELPRYIEEIAVSLFPIVLFFVIFQLAVIHLSKNNLLKIVVGIVYTYIGLVLFLTGVNVGFLPAGYCLGEIIANFRFPWIIVPVAMLMGFFVVRAEPAVYVLNKQVEEITDGNISAAAMGYGLSIGVSVSLGIAMIRVLTGISIMWFLIPGYAIALIISFFVPKIYTAIAFDSGGVASGPMTATFLLPFAQGACAALGGDIVTDAFGIVAMVAMTPLITIQVMGLISLIKDRKSEQTDASESVSWENLDDDTIIDL